MSPIVMTAALIALTVFAYRLSLAARRRWPGPLTTPVLFSTIIIVGMMLLAHRTLADYAPARSILTFLLGPATVALAIPLYRNRATFSRQLLPALSGLVAGSLLTMATAIVTARAFGLDKMLASSLAVKSVTVAFAVDIARIVHGDPSLAAGFVVCTGMIGASLGPLVLNRTGVRLPVARGIAFGTIAHGQGTAEAASENEFSGAVAGVAMCVAGIFTSLAAPIVVPLLVR